MIKGLGTDIIEVDRMKKRLNNEPDFTLTIFTKDEIKYCESFKFKEQNYAARFAAKEAFLKALGTGWRDGLSFDQIEIINDEFGKPHIKTYNKASETLNKMQIKNIHISLSHTKDYAMSTVILES